MKPIKFVHMADLHLEKPFKGLPPAIAAQRRQDLWATLGKVVEFCQQQQVDLLLIAGDLLEYHYISTTHCRRLNHYFSQLPNTQIIIAPGNHDACYQDSYYRTYAWCDNVHIFLEETLASKHFPELDLTVWGLGWSRPEIREEWLNGIDLPAKHGQPSIMLLHGDIYDQHSIYLPLDAKQLNSLPVDYVALGHIHAGGSSGKLRYPGSTAPLDWSEQGEHGVMLGELTQQEAKVEFIPLAQREFIELRVSVNYEDTPEELAVKIKEHLSAQGEQHIYRITLEGEHEDGLSLVATLELLLKDSVFHCQVIDQTEPAFDVTALAEGQQGKAAALFLEKVSNLSEDYSTEEISAIRKFGLDALLRKKVMRNEV